MQIIFCQLYMELYDWYKHVFERDFHCPKRCVYTESNKFPQIVSKPVTANC